MPRDAKNGQEKLFSATVYVCLCLAPKSLIPRVTVPNSDARVLSRLSRTSSVRTFPFEKESLISPRISLILFVLSVCPITRCAKTQTQLARSFLRVGLALPHTRGRCNAVSVSANPYQSDRQTPQTDWRIS